MEALAIASLGLAHPDIAFSQDQPQIRSQRNCRFGDVYRPFWDQERSEWVDNAEAGLSVIIFANIIGLSAP